MAQYLTLPIYKALFHGFIWRSGGVCLGANFGQGKPKHKKFPTQV